MDTGYVKCIIKLGGSAITDKNQLETAKNEEIERAVCLVKQCFDAGRGCIVVHGAGSFGHHHAKEYKVNQGFSDAEEKEQNRVKIGFCKTRLSVTKLNHLVVEECVKQGLPAVGHSPCGRWVTGGGGQVVSSSVTDLWSLLQAGFIPVLHGDCVLDLQQGCRILSGDTIIQELCKEFKPPVVVFLSDVDGVFDRPPDQPGARLVEEMSVYVDGDIDLNIETSTHTQDVTGGIRYKLDSAVNIVKTSHGHSRVFICNVNSTAARNAMLYGELKQEPGTMLTYKQS